MKENLLDIRYCLMKQAEYDAKARQASDERLRATYEAAALRFAERIRQLVSNRLDEPIAH